MRRWKDNIKMDLRELWFIGVYWIHLARNGYQWCAAVDTVMTLLLP
jgi:hypothetical protein